MPQILETPHLVSLRARGYLAVMRYANALIPARLRKRYKRFLCDAQLEGGREVTAHCPNPGSMLSLIEADAEIWLAAADNPKRKLPYSWELVRRDGGLVGLNTGRANALVAEALAAGKIAELAAMASCGARCATEPTAGSISCWKIRPARPATWRSSR